MTREERAAKIEEAARTLVDEIYDADASDGMDMTLHDALRAALAAPVEEPGAPEYGCIMHGGKHAWIAQGAKWICECGAYFPRRTTHTPDDETPRIRGIDIGEARYIDDGQGWREETVTLREEPPQDGSPGTGEEMGT